MKKDFLRRMLILILLLVFVLPVTVSATPDNPDVSGDHEVKVTASGGPAPVAENVVTVDITYDSKTGKYSFMGLPMEALLSLGLLPLDTAYLPVPSGLNQVGLVVDSTAIRTSINGEPLTTQGWDADRRSTVLGLMLQASGEYGWYAGIDFTPDQAARVGHWLSSSSVAVNLRFTDKLSERTVLYLRDPIQVDIKNDWMYVEQFPIPVLLQPSVADTLKNVGVRNAVLCLDNGTVTGQVAGMPVPDMTFHPEGLAELNKVMELGIYPGFITQTLGVTAGFDISLDGAQHSSVKCGQ
ncbi:secreted protein [sediment metagenome]|uniref:Secreted protein n=1 Tax=sediment metagenome TaxID=749907 RepID=D9PJK6_9ZZZZ